MIAWYSKDIAGRRHRAALKSLKTARARVADRRAWLLVNHASVTAQEAAAHWKVSRGTIRDDERALGVICKPEPAPHPRERLHGGAPQQDAHAAWVSAQLRSWR